MLHAWRPLPCTLRIIQLQPIDCVLLEGLRLCHGPRQRSRSTKGSRGYVQALYYRGHVDWTRRVGEPEGLEGARRNVPHAANQHLQSMPGGHSSSKILMNRNLQPVDSSTAYLSVVYSMSTIFLGAFTSVIIRLFSILSQPEWRREQSSGDCSLLYRTALRSASQTEASQM